MPTGFRQDVWQRTDVGAVFPAVMGQADQAVALRVAAGEQRAARRRAQRRGGVRAGEDNALRGELVEPRAGNVGVAVGAEVAAEVVPMHEQHVVASLGHCASLSSPVGTPNSAHGYSATLWLTDEVIHSAEFIHRFGLVASCSAVFGRRSN